MKDEFLAQYQPKTRAVYGYVLDEAEGYLDKPLRLFSHSDVVYYQEQIADQSAATVARKLATLGAYFNYLNISGQRVDNPMAGVRRPTVDPLRTVQWLTDAESHALLGAAVDDPRAHALVWIGLHGLRVSEVVSLNVEQYADGTLRNVEGKGGKSRSVPLATEAQRSVERYIGMRKSGPLFRTSRGRMSASFAREMVCALTESIGHKVSIHALRHTYGTRAIRRGVDSITLAKLMGHSSTRTTEKYVHLDTTDLREANELVYPTEKPSLSVMADKVALAKG